MPEFNNFGSLEKYIKSKIDDTLKEEVAEFVKETEAIAAQKIVYGAYSPGIYDRRGGAGGVGDMDNMNAKVADGLLTVTNETPFNPGYGTENRGDGLAGLVEFGDGYGGAHYEYLNKSDESPFSKPRPFIQTTREQLGEGGCDLIKAAIKYGLNSRGIQTK